MPLLPSRPWIHLQKALEKSLPIAMSNRGNWPIQTGNYANTRYSDLDQINKYNVSELRVAWTFSTGVLRGHDARRW